ncbi:FMN-binding protein [Acidobacteriota bacterium]
MKKSLLSILFMFLITLAFTALVSTVRTLSLERIETNQALKLRRIILKVLDIKIPDSISDRELSDMFLLRIKVLEVQNRVVYIGYAEDRTTIQGYAFPIGGPGFWGPISGIAAVTPDASRILGIAFDRHSETPGLGGRITEEWFVEQFKGLRLFPIEGGNNIFFLKSTDMPKAANEIDAITGASNTSAAVEAFLNRDLDVFLKDIWKELKSRE